MLGWRRRLVWIGLRAQQLGLRTREGDIHGSERSGATARARVRVCRNETGNGKRKERRKSKGRGWAHQINKINQVFSLLHVSANKDNPI